MAHIKNPTTSADRARAQTRITETLAAAGITSHLRGAGSGSRMFVVPPAEAAKAHDLVAALVERERLEAWVPPRGSSSARRGPPLLAEDRPGFWETRGYSNTARPWEDGRYSR